VTEAREHGLKESVKRLFERTKDSFSKNVIPHFKSKENFKALLNRVGDKLKIDKVAETVANALTFIKERISQYMEKRRNEPSEASWQDDPRWSLFKEKSTGFLRKLKSDVNEMASDYYERNLKDGPAVEWSKTQKNPLMTRTFFD